MIAALPPQQVPDQGECSSLLIPGRPIEHGFRLPGGERAVLRDPYGGLVSRNRRFVQFSVKSAQRERLVDHVEWRFDSAPVDGNRGGAYALRLLSTRLPAGEHSLTAHVVLRDGAAVDHSADLRVTDCQPVTFTADVLGRRAATLTTDSGGPAVRGVGFTIAKGLRARIPRGRSAGTLSLSGAPQALPLRAPKRGGVLLRRGALKVTLRAGRGDFLLVTGLPAGTSGVRVTLRGVLRKTRPCPVTATVRATLVGADGGAAALDSGGRCRPAGGQRFLGISANRLE